MKLFNRFSVSEYLKNKGCQSHTETQKEQVGKYLHPCEEREKEESAGNNRDHQSYPIITGTIG